MKTIKLKLTETIFFTSFRDTVAVIVMVKKQTLDAKEDNEKRINWY